MYLSIGQVSHMIGVSPSSLRRWDENNILQHDYRTPGKHRRYSYRKILKFLGLSNEKQEEEKQVVIYARVSANKQKEDLKRQVKTLENYAEDNNWKVRRIYKDIASGLNDGRKNLLKLISDLPKAQVDYVLCTYKDRLARFGTRMLEQFCNIYGTELLEINISDHSEEQELVSTIIAILTSFSGKLYRQRRGKNQVIPK